MMDLREKDFYRRQTTEKALLRIREGRATLFDKYFVNTQKCGVINTDDPAGIGENEELDENIIQETLSWESDSTAIEFWMALQEWLSKRKNQSSGIDVVREDVEGVFTKRSFEELCRLEVQIKMHLVKRNSDPDYWTAVLIELGKIKVKIHLLECHHRLLSMRKAENELLVEVKDIEVHQPTEAKSSSLSPSTGKDSTFFSDEWDNSPRAIKLFQHYDCIAFGNQGERIYEETTDIPIPEDQLLLKRPRYVAYIFLRIIWTKYNQAHYSSSNPPSATPQGYRFHIFYPEATDTPTYRTEADPRGSETQLIRFMARPYRDLVFRVIAQKWELGHRQGFVCTFEDDILTLNFRFNRLVYRR